MMNMFQMISMLQNMPAAMVQQAMQQMIANNPEAWKQAQEEYKQLGRDGMAQKYGAIYNQNGVNMNQLAHSMGLRL